MPLRLRAVLCVLLMACAGCRESPPSSPHKTVTPTQEGKRAVSKDEEKHVGHVEVQSLRTPDDGIQPQAVVDGSTLHLIYFKGPPQGGDIYYVRSADGGATFTKPLRVNSQPGSAVATGSIRGAHLAVGAGGRPHVAWMGSQRALPKAPGGAAPMLYARLDDAGTAFEAQRNLIQEASGLDGGGSVAAAGDDVYVVWHAPSPGDKGEGSRQVWVAASADGGKTFARERAISPADTGVCPCCGIRAFASEPGLLRVVYRSAADGVHRDTYLLTGGPGQRDFAHRKLDPWELEVCPMSGFALARAGAVGLGAWETAGQIYYARLSPDGTGPFEPVPAPGRAGKRRHPALAWNGSHVLLAWTEGTGWERGGSVAWQVFDGLGRPAAERGRAGGVPVWGLVTSVALPDGRFLVIY